MRGKTSWFLVAVLFMAVLAFQATPAKALFPEGWSIVTFDVTGSLMDCIDIGRGTANAYLSGKRGTCTAAEQFATGRTRMSCTWRNIDFSFFAPGTRELNMDFTCSRWGGPFFWFGSEPPASCGAGVSYKRIDQFGANVTFNEGHAAATIGGRRKCSSIFGPLTADEVERFDIRRYLKRRPR